MIKRDDLNHWPALLDLVTATMMIFLMVTFLHTLLNVDAMKNLLIKTRQDSFSSAFQRGMSSEIDAGMISIEDEPGALRITFSDRVLFKSADFRLQPSGMDLLARCAEVLASIETSAVKRIQVEGHTDNQDLERASYPANNWQLSSARAMSVVEFLARDESLEPKLSANGYAQFRPVAENVDEKGRARNRRIEIRVFFSDALESGNRVAESPLPLMSDKA